MLWGSWWGCAATVVPVETVESVVSVEAAVDEVPLWPSPGAPLSPIDVVVPEGFGTRRIVVDAGHGAPNNGGNTSCGGEREQDVTLRHARGLAERLAKVGAFDVRLARDGALVPYADRLSAANAWKADAFLSLHTDARAGEVAFQQAGHWCTDGADGLAVLWSDEGAAGLVGARQALARAITRRSAQTGLLPYGGADYGGLYEPDAEALGAFLDRHEARRRIMVLRRSQVPTVIIETHNALDPDEPARWEESATQDAFASAVAAALIDVLGIAAPGSVLSPNGGLR